MLEEKFNKLIIDKKINNKNRVHRFFSGIVGSIVLLTMGGNVTCVNASSDKYKSDILACNSNSYSNIFEFDEFKTVASNSEWDVNKISDPNKSFDHKSYYYNSDMDFLLFKYSNVTNEDLLIFPNTIKTLKLHYCLFVNDLSYIPEKYPNLKFLEIYCCPSLSDLSFIYNLKNIETVYIFESAFITQELVDYLNNNNINHNLTEKDVLNSKKVDDIVDNLIDEDMDDKKKIQSICSYVVEHYEYDIEKEKESNMYPLTTMLEGNTCVCAGYAYFTNVLLTKANINSYEILSDVHGWNLIELDGKFYYIDTTNIDQIPYVSQFFLEKFNMGIYYMTSPSDISFSTMEPYDSDIIIIPPELVDDIRNGESEKNLYEKYGKSVPIRIIQLLILLEFMPIFLTGILIKKNKEKIKNKFNL